MADTQCMKSLKRYLGTLNNSKEIFGKLSTLISLYFTALLHNNDYSIIFFISYTAKMLRRQNISHIIACEKGM